MSEEKRYTEEEAHQFFAKRLNGEVWGLLEKPDRTKEDDEMMIHAAHASCRHWLTVGTGLNQQRGEWLISHVYAELGIADAALRHAYRCQELTGEHADLMEDFDRAYAFECVARANAIAGNRDEASKYIALAEKAGQEIKDEQSRKFFVGDFNGGNWNDLK